MKKLIYFLAGCEKKNLDERGEFEKRLAVDGAFRTKVGEDLLLLLERQDHFEKASLLGKIFSGRLREEIDEDTFFRLASTIDRASIADLRRLETSYSRIDSYDPTLGKRFSDTQDDATCQSLYNAGLVRSEGATESIYLRNELGSCLIRILKE